MNNVIASMLAARKLAGNRAFVRVTDRVDLDVQIVRPFKVTGTVSEADGDQCRATNGAHLRELSPEDQVPVPPVVSKTVVDLYFTRERVGRSLALRFHQLLPCHDHTEPSAHKRQRHRSGQPGH